MLNIRLLTPVSLLPMSLLIAAATLAPAAAQELAPHRAVYAVSALDRGKPGTGTSGTYAYELKLTCDGGYVVNQRLRLETAGGRGAAASEQQSQMTESRDGKKLRFEHRTSTGGRQTSLVKGEALIGDDGKGEARFTDPEGQTVALPATTLFPVAIARETIRQAKAGEQGFDAQFFFGEKVKPPQSVNILIGKLPKRLADVKIPEGGEQLADGRTRIYYRAGFFDAQADGKGKGQGEPAYEMSSVTLDNGVELYGTHEESDGGIEYRITRLEPLPKPECK
ncbi:MAG: cell envelope integrity EipB family protein [Reyranella sp.]|nr:cell envelope integrity EipB family protein [Reyranella sp.]